MKPAASTFPQVQLLELRLIQGYLPGRKQPTVVARLSFNNDSVSQRDLALFDRIVETHLASDHQFKLSEKLSEHVIWGRLAQATLSLLAMGGMPLFDAGNAVFMHQKRGNAAGLLMPALEHAPGAVGLALNAVLDIMNLTLSGKQPETVADKLDTVRESIRRFAPRGINSMLFLKAAHEAGVPWRYVNSKIYQYGWGAKARWLDSSFTDETSVIGASVARDKVASASVLRKAGLPVPEHRLVRSAEAAVDFAQHLGYPVVVKPADMDGGKGVFALLRTEQSVKDAYAKVVELSGRILVEKHFEGNDYRLQVHHGDVFWISHRIPGGVTGDGIGTVEQLLEKLNADPMRGERGTNAWRKRIPLDDEALGLLREEGLDRNSVPEDRQFVRLRRACNVATGGVPVPALDGAHPDNLELGARAARVLRLDLAGVDLLIPDIKQSWRHSGAAICEVNAQPQLSRQLHAELLGRLLTDNGRIPAIVVIGDLGQTSWYGDLQAWAAQSGHCMGLATGEGVWIDGLQVGSVQGDTHEAGLAMLLDPKVDVALFQLTDDSAIQTGLPVDRADLLVVTDLIGSPSGSDMAQSKRLFSMVGRMSESTCLSEHLMNSQEALELAGLSEVECLPSAQILKRIKYCIQGEL
jgi:cyanophycin synthetase